MLVSPDVEKRAISAAKAAEPDREWDRVTFRRAAGTTPKGIFTEREEDRYRRQALTAGAAGA